MGGSPPGSAGVPPAQHWQNLAHLLEPGRPATAPGLCFGRAHAVPADRVAGCRIAGKLSGNPRERMRAGRPRSRGGPLSSRLPFKGESAQPNWLDGRLKSQFDNPLVALRGPSWITLFLLFQVSRLIPSRAFGGGHSFSFVFFLLFQVSRLRAWRRPPTRFLRTPTPSISTVTTSPGCIPLVVPGVPVKIRSPGSRVTYLLIKLTVSGIP